LVIAIDFDGTIVEDAYPQIGEPKLFAFETLQEMQKAHHQLILWTTREGQELEEAVDFCRKNGVEFYAVNNSYPEESFENDASRKINCELFISHKNIGGLEGGGEIWQEIKAMTGEDKLYKPEGMTGGGLFEKLAKLFR
jgi:hypothetical protein